MEADFLLSNKLLFDMLPVNSTESHEEHFCQSIFGDEWALLVSGVCALLPPPFSERIINQID
ncbi:hypothetical protein PAMP_007673 [Pampus punctatissimus]